MDGLVRSGGEGRIACRRQGGVLDGGGIGRVLVAGWRSIDGTMAVVRTSEERRRDRRRRGIGEEGREYGGGLARRRSLSRRTIVGGYGNASLVGKGLDKERGGAKKHSNRA